MSPNRILLWTALLSAFYFLCGCSSLHFSQGLIDPAFGGQIKDGPRQFSALHTSVQLEATPYQNEYIRIDLGIGPSTTVPLDGRSSLYGAELGNRITFVPKKQLSPYLYHAHGLHYHDTGGWHEKRYTNPVEHYGSDARHEFSTRFGAGIAYKPTEKLTVDLSYQWFHMSNGKSMFSRQTFQFFGLNQPKANDGTESGAIFLGVTYEF